MPGVITMSSLGSRGRAGNALFQYAFLRGYAKTFSAEIQTPDWWGRNVFPVAAADPLIDRVLPKTVCDSVNPVMGRFVGKTDIDLFGYFQHQMFIDFYRRWQVREWFAIKPELYEYSPAERGIDPYSAKHMRRGDYERPPFNKLYCTVSDESYDKAIEEFNIPAPIMAIYDGCEVTFKHLDDLGVPWLHDFLILRDADHLLRANSSFSWWAGTLGTGKVFSPLVFNRVGPSTVEFVEGNWPNTAGIFHNQSDMHLKE